MDTDITQYPFLFFITNPIHEQDTEETTNLKVIKPTYPPTSHIYLAIGFDSMKPLYVRSELIVTIRSAHYTTKTIIGRIKNQ